MSAKPTSPAGLGLSLEPENAQASELEALLTGLAQLPQNDETEMLRSLFRIDVRLGELVRIMGEAEPGE